VWAGALYFREECGVGLQGRFGLEGSTGDLWLAEEGGGEGPGGPGVVSLEKVQRERDKGLQQGFFNQMPKVCMHLLSPSSKH
jgi:hypothetical protein